MNVPRNFFVRPRVPITFSRLAGLMVACLLFALRARAGLLGADINADPYLMQGDYTGANPGYTYPLFNQPGVNATAFWDDMVEQYDSAQLDFVAIWLKGDKQTAGMPASFEGLVAAINKRGLTNKLKIMPFDDNPASWTAQWDLDHGDGYDYNVAFDLSNTNNWVYIWDNNLKIFWQSVPDANRLKINGRPVYSIWSLAPAFFSNVSGNGSKMLTWLRQQCQATFGFNPYIEVPEEWVQNDPSSNDPNIIDAIRPWFVPVVGSGAFSTWNTYTYNGVELGCVVPAYGYSGSSTWIDPNHGATLATGLQDAVGPSAMTFVEGFDDFWEATTCWRARNLDANGNAQTYTQMGSQDYPNQRINILREYGNNPFPTDLKEEAEGCDTFGGGVGGGYSANYYRNGNISIYPCTDTYGGYYVGNIQTGQWLQWQAVPLPGSFHISVRVATANATGSLHFVIDGTSYPSVTLPNTGGLSNWQTVDAGGYTFPANSYHTVTLMFDNGGYNVNFWQLTSGVVVTTPPATPTGLAATAGDAQVNLSWSSSSGATGYNLKRSATSGGTYTTIAAGLSGVTDTDTSVTNGSTYYYEVSATNNYGESANSAPVNATPSLAATLVTWFKANAITGVNNGAALATWTDASGNGDNATQTTTAQQPTYVTGAMNGLPVVRFNSANSTYMSFNRPVQGDFTIMCVFQSTQGLNSGTLYFQGAGLVNGEVAGVANDFGTCLFANGSISAGTGDPDTAVDSGANYNNGKPHVLTFERTESSGMIALYVDGVAAGSTTAGTQALTAPAVLVLGAQQTLLNFLSGDIAEVKIYDTPLVTADRQAQESALGTEYGIAGLSSGPLPASKLAILQQPSGTATAGQAFAQQPVVLVQDSSGNTVTNYSGTIVASETSGGTLNGATGNSVSVTVVSGVGTFSGLYVTNVSSAVTLTFTSGSLPATNSSAINVSAPALVASKLVIQQQPSGTATAGQAFAQQPVVVVQNSSGATVTTYSGTIVASETSGGTLNGATGNSVSVTVVSGVGTFSGLYVTNVSSAVTLTFTSGSLPATNSSAINVSAASGGGPGPVTQLIWTTQPGNAASGQLFGTQPVLKTADATGTPSTVGLPASLYVTITLSNGNGPLTGTTTGNLGTSGGNGVMSFSDLRIGAAGSGDQLTASLIPAPGAVIWLDANNAGTITTNASGVVSNWTNLGTRGAALGVPASVNGNTWTGPSWVGGSMNGRPVIRFNSTSTTQNPPGNVLTNSWTGLDTGTDIHFFTVMRQAANPISNWPGFIGFGNSGAAAGKNNSSLGEDTGDSSGGFRIFRNDADGSPSYSNAGQFTLANYPSTGIGANFSETALGAWYNQRPANNAAFMNAFYFQGSANGGADYWLDQSGNTWTNFQASTASYGNFNITDFGIGAQLGINSGSPLDGPDWPLSVDIAEVLVYTNTLSVADRAAVQTYLQGKWLSAALFTSAATASFNVTGAGGTTPALSVSPVAQKLVLSWPTNNTSAFGLQFSPTLLPGTWSSVAATVGVTNGTYQAAVPLGSAAGFYRLAH